MAADCGLARIGRPGTRERPGAPGRVRFGCGSGPRGSASSGAGSSRGMRHCGGRRSGQRGADGGVFVAVKPNRCVKIWVEGIEGLLSAEDAALIERRASAVTAPGGPRCDRLCLHVFPEGYERRRSATVASGVDGGCEDGREDAHDPRRHAGRGLAGLRLDRIAWSLTWVAFGGTARRDRSRAGEAGIWIVRSRSCASLVGSVRTGRVTVSKLDETLQEMWWRRRESKDRIWTRGSARIT